MEDEVFYYVIYYRDGRKRESGYFQGAGAEVACERAAQLQFDFDMQAYIHHPQAMPTRWDVKKR